MDADHGDMKTFKDVWGEVSPLNESLATFQGNFINFFDTFGRLDIITDPAFLAYSILLALVTVIEISVTIRMARTDFRTSCGEKREMIGIGISNILIGTIGL